MLHANFSFAYDLQFNIEGVKQDYDEVLYSPTLDYIVSRHHKAYGQNSLWGAEVWTSGDEGICIIDGKHATWIYVKEYYTVNGVEGSWWRFRKLYLIDHYQPQDLFRLFVSVYEDNNKLYPFEIVMPEGLEGVRPQSDRLENAGSIRDIEIWADSNSLYTKIVPYKDDGVLVLHCINEYIESYSQRIFIYKYVGDEWKLCKEYDSGRRKLDIIPMDASNKNVHQAVEQYLEQKVNVDLCDVKLDEQGNLQLIAEDGKTVIETIPLYNLSPLAE